MKTNAVLRFYLILGLLLMVSRLFGQIDEDRIKASMLYYISDFIIWPEQEQFQKFSIGILGDRSVLLDELNHMVQQKKIKKVPIIVSRTSFENISGNFQLLFVSNEYYNRIEEILSICKKHHTLLVTDQLDNNLFSVINFTRNVKTQTINFEVNKQNLVLSQLDYKDDLLLFGGNLIDVKELYKSTQRQLEEFSNQIKRLNEDIRKKDEEIKYKNEDIVALSKNIEISKNTLGQLNVLIDSQNNTIQLQRKQVIFQNQQYLMAKEEYDSLKSMQDMQLKSIRENEKELAMLDREIHESKSIIAKQSETLSTKESAIRNKNRILILLLFLGLSLLITGILIFRAYSIKQRYNIKLEDTIADRTHDLIQLNQSLQGEVSKRKLSEVQLLKSERNYREIFNSSTNSIFIHNMEGKILDVNESMLSTYGYDRSEIPDLTIGQLSSLNENYGEKEALSWVTSAINEGNQVFDWQAKRKNGEIFWVEVTLKKTNIGDEDRLMAIVRDINEKKINELELENYRKQLENMVADRTKALSKLNNELSTMNDALLSVNTNLATKKTVLEETILKLQQTQNQLIESEKMASVGILAAGVAHEINNPLNFIKSGVFALDTYIKEKGENEENELKLILKSIGIGVDRAANIVKSLNHFSRKSDKFDEYCDLHAIIENTLTILQSQIINKIEILKNYYPEKLIVYGNEGKLHQVILNIITNAVQSIQDNGIIKINTEKDDKMCKILITDNGSGIQSSMKSKIFSPFFTTKEPGKGTGLGLSISHKIISDHNGNIDIESIENKGTTVTITLPINIITSQG